MIAHFIKITKPRSKLIILDPKRSFSKQPLFVEAFEGCYKGIVELHLSTDIDGFSVAAQRAAEIAFRAGCTDGDWCPVHPGETLCISLDN